MTYGKLNPETGEYENYNPEKHKSSSVVLPLGVFMRTPYNYDTDQVSEETGLSCPEETKTQQQFKDDADINNIVERYGITGEMPPSINMPDMADYMEVMDFQEAQNVLVAAQREFMKLPGKVRAQFNNSPHEFTEFFNNPANQDEAIRLGLATDKRPPPNVESQTPPSTTS